MTSTSEFFGASASLTVYMPPGSSEAVLMIETMDAVASVTLPSTEVQRLVVLLQSHRPGHAAIAEDDKPLRIVPDTIVS